MRVVALAPRRSALPLTAGLTAGVRVVGQIVFGPGTPATFAAYVVQGPALSLGDGNAPDPGYDSPGLGLSLTVMGQTASQAALPSGVGRPGTAQLRAVGAASGGYLSTIFPDSQAGPTPAPAANFTRLCV